MRAILMMMCAVSSSSPPIRCHLCRLSCSESSVECAEQDCLTKRNEFRNCTCCRTIVEVVLQASSPRIVSQANPHAVSPMATSTSLLEALIQFYAECPHHLDLSFKRPDSSFRPFAWLSCLDVFSGTTSSRTSPSVMADLRHRRKSAITPQSKSSLKEVFNDAFRSLDLVACCCFAGAGTAFSCPQCARQPTPHTLHHHRPLSRGSLPERISN